MEVKLFADQGELFVLAKSEGRRAKETAMRHRRLARLLWKLRALRRSCPSRDQLLLRIGAAKKEAGRAYSFVHLRLPKEGDPVTRQSFTFGLDKDKLRKSELQDGHYLLRSNLVSEDPAILWDRYVQLTQIEAAFKPLKSELGLRPIYHELEHRMEAHILIAFLAYCLLVTLKNRLQALAPGLTPRAVLEKLATIQMLDVYFPTTDGRWLLMPRYTHPSRINSCCCTGSSFPCPSNRLPGSRFARRNCQQKPSFRSEDLLSTLAEKEGLNVSSPRLLRK